MSVSTKPKKKGSRKPRPGINERIDNMNHEELTTIVKRIVWTLYFDEETARYEPGLEWDAETIEHVDEVIRDYSLVPRRGKNG